MQEASRRLSQAALPAGWRVSLEPAAIALQSPLAPEAAAGPAECMAVYLERMRSDSSDSDAATSPLELQQQQQQQRILIGHFATPAALPAFGGMGPAMVLPAPLSQATNNLATNLALSPHLVNSFATELHLASNLASRFAANLGAAAAHSSSSSSSSSNTVALPAAAPAAAPSGNGAALSGAMSPAPAAVRSPEQLLLPVPPSPSVAGAAANATPTSPPSAGDALAAASGAGAVAADGTPGGKKPRKPRHCPRCSLPIKDRDHSKCRQEKMQELHKQLPGTPTAAGLASPTPADQAPPVFAAAGAGSDLSPELASPLPVKRAAPLPPNPPVAAAIVNPRDFDWAGALRAVGVEATLAAEIALRLRTQHLAPSQLLMLPAEHLSTTLRVLGIVDMSLHERVLDAARRDEFLPSPPVIEVKKKRKKNRKTYKFEPGYPKRPLTSYVLFCTENREEQKRLHPDKKPNEIERVLGEVWQSLPAVEKEKYQAAAAEDLARYRREVAIFKAQHPQSAGPDSLHEEQSEPDTESSVPSFAVDAAIDSQLPDALTSQEAT